jgi:two-component system, NtrC family, sensor histidine kinase GlrK
LGFYHYETRNPERIIGRWHVFDYQTLKLMKEPVINFIQDIYRQVDLSKLKSKLQSIFEERFDAFYSRIKFKDILSLKSLIVLGFVIAVIPLFLAVMYAAFGMRETSALGRTINSQVFEQTKSIRLVMQKTSDIERKARLFVLLSDPAVRQPYEQKSYENTRASFKQALNELLSLHINNKITLLVNELSEKENLIYQQIIGLEDEGNLQLPVDQVFQGLRESSNSLSREFEYHVEHDFNELRIQSESLEQGLLTKGAVLLVISFIFIALLLFMVSRSVRQLDAAIRRLGLGELDEPINVEGPSDLRYLGNRLEWLRTHLIGLEASKQQFMHNVALEIDQPLQNICASVGHLANVEDDDEKPNSARQDIARQLSTNADKLRTVYGELVRYSQVNTKPEASRKASTNMKSLLESVIEDFQPRLQAKSISLKQLVRPIEILGIQEQLRSILEQLMLNAVRYSPVGGEIRIMLRGSGKLMELEVEDEGPGIDPDERPHVFEPFFRGKTIQGNENAEGLGLGLGLAIVKEYVANHQGKVDIIDPRQDQNGARIRIQLPLTGEA